MADAALTLPEGSLFDLHQQVVLLTGPYGHLGRAIAFGLAAHGAMVVALGRDEEVFHTTFGAASDRIQFIRCDVANTASVQVALASSNTRYGLPSVLINNAFYSRGNQPAALSDEDFAYGLDGSLGSAYRCIREVLPYLRQLGRGKIINVASMYGVVAPDFAAYSATPQYINPPHYGAAKAGVIQLTKYFASYLGHDNIQVNCVSPGAFPNAEVQQSGEFIEALTQRIPLGRIGQPADLAGAFVFLASQASDFVTGHNLVVDGGWTIK